MNVTLEMKLKHISTLAKRDPKGEMVLNNKVIQKLTRLALIGLNWHKFINGLQLPEYLEDEHQPTQEGL